MTDEFKRLYSQRLEACSEDLDIPPSKYMQAVKRYRDVKKFLSDGEDDVQIYLQGSFRLGTIIRPIKNSEDCAYDIDLVCKFSTPKQHTSARKIKEAVGKRLNEDGTYSLMMDEEGNRCWTLEYAEDDDIGFHIDILPSVSEDQGLILTLTNDNVPYDLAETSIAITHRKTNGDYIWDTSNPDGYGRWFDLQQAEAFSQVYEGSRNALYEGHRELFNNVDEVPDQLIKTPLQRAIQILKRHRDIRFTDNPNEDKKPISMIITTLAAQLYQNETNISDTLQNIIQQLKVRSGLLEKHNSIGESMHLPNLIQRVGDEWRIENPVNTEENFADRWHEDNNARAKAFFQWVDWVHEDLVSLLDNQDNLDHLDEILNELNNIDTVEEQPAIAAVAAPAIIPVRTPHIEIEDPNPPWREN